MGLHGNDLVVEHAGSAPRAHHERHVGPVDVDVDQAHLGSGLLSASARLTAIVDLPTPPLPDDTATVCFTSGMNSAAGRGAAGGWAGRAAAAEPIFTCTLLTPGNLRDRLDAPLCSATLVAGGWRRERQGERDARIVDVEVLDQPEGDDVLACVWVLDRAEDVQDARSVMLALAGVLMDGSRLEMMRDLSSQSIRTPLVGPSSRTLRRPTRCKPWRT